jgi:hypothetical protein
MRHLSRRLAVMTALALVLASAASAQGRPQTREGFWIGFGFGYGSLGFDCPGCGDEREGALSGYLKLGGTLSPKLLLGGETNGWSKDISGTTVTAANASAVLYFYPSASGGFFLRGGLGWATLEIGDVSESGGGAVFGTGFDIRMGAKTSITPVLNFNFGSLANNFRQNVVQLAVGVTFH